MNEVEIKDWIIVLSFTVVVAFVTAVFLNGVDWEESPKCEILTTYRVNGSFDWRNIENCTRNYSSYTPNHEEQWNVTQEVMIEGVILK